MFFDAFTISGIIVSVLMVAVVVSLFASKDHADQMSDRNMANGPE